MKPSGSLMFLEITGDGGSWILIFSHTQNRWLLKKIKELP
jgi:hypothetical protein